MTYKKVAVKRIVVQKTYKDHCRCTSCNLWFYTGKKEDGCGHLKCVMFVTISPETPKGVMRVDLFKHGTHLRIPPNKKESARCPFCRHLLRTNTRRMEYNRKRKEVKRIDV